MDIEIINTNDSFTPNYKRFYMPAIIKWKCPGCGKEMETDLTGDYFSYPEMNKDFEHVVWCQGCDGEFPITLKIEVSLKLMPTKES